MAPLPGGVLLPLLSKIFTTTHSQVPADTSTSVRRLLRLAARVTYSCEPFDGQSPYLFHGDVADWTAPDRVLMTKRLPNRGAYNLSENEWTTSLRG